MSLPVRSLPMLQNWDCHVGGSCCKEYQVTITEEEKQRIEAQGWSQLPEFQGIRLFKKGGSFFKPVWQLNHDKSGSCVFLSPEGRCRIHEKFGYETKPLPCRLFPFLLIPAGDHWRVGIRYACPSAAANLGRPVEGHHTDLQQFADMLVMREGLQIGAAGFDLKPPLLQPGQRVLWSDLLLFVDAILEILRNRRDRMERRLRKCLALANLARQAKYDKFTGPRLKELLDLLMAGLEGEVTRNPATTAAPGWIGRILFRQALAIFTRKDQGPQRGPNSGRRLSLLRAAWRFARGTGSVPRLHAGLPETTFEQVESCPSLLNEETELLLERYYLVKVHSLHFFGPAFFGYPFWDGLEVLTLTFPMLMWIARMFTGVKPTEACMRSLSIVDDHFGFNYMLASARQRASFRIMSRFRELEKLIAWYGRPAKG